MNDIKKESVERLQKKIAKYEQEISDLERIAKALKVYKGKLYDKRFLRANGFVTVHDYGYGKREFFKHELHKHRWSWKSGYEMYIGNDYYVEVESRECADVLKAILAELEKRTNWKLQSEDELKKVQMSDVDNVRAKLIELRDTSNITGALWRELLEDFKVKYE